VKECIGRFLFQSIAVNIRFLPTILKQGAGNGFHRLVGAHHT